LQHLPFHHSTANRSQFITLTTTTTTPSLLLLLLLPLRPEPIKAACDHFLSLCD
jgi:hypothetical protein